MADSKKVRVDSPGDWQIWVVPGQFGDGQAWRLPIRALPFQGPDGEEILFVRSMMELTPQMYVAIVPVLDKKDFCPSDERGWWLKRAHLDEIAVRAPGITFERYIQWPEYVPPSPLDGESSPQELQCEPEPGLSRAETLFLKRLQLVAGDLSFDAIKHLWLSIRKEAVKLLAIERKPVDLGFIRLVPVPYRANWKEMLCVRFNSLLHVMKRPQAEWKLDSLGLHGALASVRMFAIDRQHRFIHWTIESVPSKELDRAIDEQENAIFSRIGAVSYAKRVLKEVAGRLTDILDVLKAYTDEVSLSIATTATGNRDATVLIPDPSGVRVRPGKGLCEYVDAVITDAMESFTDTKPEIAEKPKRLESDERTFHALFREEGFIDASPLSPSRGLNPPDSAEPNSRLSRLDVEESTESSAEASTRSRCDRNGADQPPEEPPADIAAA